MRTQTSLTATQEILLGAADLFAKGRSEFTEWDLTIAVWERDRNKFGCRGYEDQYPDHKRVMMEIMSRKKKDNPLRRGWFEKTRANHYRITPLGRAEAERLRQLKGELPASGRSPADVYNAVARYAHHQVFKDHCRDKEEPATWLGAEAFFGITEYNPLHLQDRLRSAENAVEQALAWLEETGRHEMYRGPSGGSRPIRTQELLKLKDFLHVLQERFKIQFDAIRNRRR